MSSSGKTTHELLADHDLVQRSLQEGVRKALIRHKLLGESIVVWQDGQIVELAPEDIPVDLSATGAAADTRGPLDEL